jgi:hypothetical protein
MRVSVYGSEVCSPNIVFLFHSVQCLATDWLTRVQFLAGAGSSISTSASIWPTHSTIHWILKPFLWV